MSIYYLGASWWSAVPQQMATLLLSICTTLTPNSDTHQVSIRANHYRVSRVENVDDFNPTLILILFKKLLSIYQK